MKAFYSRLEQAEQKQDARFAQLAKVCQAKLSDILAKDALLPWTWWAG